MSAVALIPARGGSKGLPGKNIRELNGRPLIEWSIQHALDCAEITDVYVSTDCPIIASIAEKAGAIVPFMRPQKFATDTASTEVVIQHFLDWCDTRGLSYESLVLLQATSPLRKVGRLDDAFKSFKNLDVDSLLAVCRTHRFFWSGGIYPKASYDYLNRPRRQDIAEEDTAFMETGSFYITKISAFRESLNRISGSIHLYETDEYEGLEIDSELDFKICEFVMWSKQKS